MNSKLDVPHSHSLTHSRIWLARSPVHSFTRVGPLVHSATARSLQLQLRHCTRSSFAMPTDTHHTVTPYYIMALTAYSTIFHFHRRCNTRLLNHMALRTFTRSGPLTRASATRRSKPTRTPPLSTLCGVPALRTCPRTSWLHLVAARQMRRGCWGQEWCAWECDVHQ